jgi:lactoylglutathione lyase
MLTRIKTVAVYVEDQERAVAFYTDKLGFEVRRKEQMGPNAYWIELAPPGAQACVLLYPRAMMADWREKRASVMFACPDAEASYCDLSERGVPFKHPPSRMPWGVFATFVDPDGNEFLMTSPNK